MSGVPSECGVEEGGEGVEGVMVRPIVAEGSWSSKPSEVSSWR